ncbi:MAG: hypothetical protein HYX69_13505 [Planctomycetia bacterium]|nr:hypothetical protein [Planctomycetia bacterium]
MSDYVDRGRRYHAAIRRIFLKHWDPVGVADVPEAQDEYDSYVGEIYAMLISHKTKNEVFDALWWIETEHMGLCGNRQQTDHVAERLIQLRSEMETGC